MADEVIAERRLGGGVQLCAKNRLWTQARRKTFLDTLASSANVELSARAAGVKGPAAYKLRYRDQAFAALWDEALATGYARVEQALIERAQIGANAVEIEGEGPLLYGTIGGAHEPEAARIVDDRVEMDVKLAQWLLERHDRVTRREPIALVSKAADRKAVEAKILKKLDLLAKRRKPA